MAIHGACAPPLLVGDILDNDDDDNADTSCDVDHDDDDSEICNITIPVRGSSYESHYQEHFHKIRCLIYMLLKIKQLLSCSNPSQQIV